MVIDSNNPVERLKTYKWVTNHTYREIGVLTGYHASMIEKVVNGKRSMPEKLLSRLNKLIDKLKI